jgi:hypothetical protein
MKEFNLIDQFMYEDRLGAYAFFWVIPWHLILYANVLEHSVPSP